MADETPESLRVSPPGDGAGLRLRVWLACLAGPAVVALGIWWVLGMFVGPYTPAESSRAVIALLACAGAGLVIGTVFAVWLDTRLSAHARGLKQALSARDVESLAELPARSGWGELSGLTRAARLALDRERRLGRAVDEAVHLEGQLAQVRGRLERWIETERWEALALEEGPLALLGGSLDRGFAREQELREQNQSVARLMLEELGSARDDARESVEQAERGFVEATALLTTVRELQRLGGELQGTLAVPVSEGPPPPSDAGDFRAAAARAIEELVAASIDSVDSLAAGLYHVQEIAEQVHAIANRSTLIALNAAVASGRGEPGAEELAAELKHLTREIRVATEKTDQLSRDVEREVRAASARMAEVRGRITLELEAAPAPAPAAVSVPRETE